MLYWLSHLPGLCLTPFQKSFGCSSLYTLIFKGEMCRFLLFIVFEGYQEPGPWRLDSFPSKNAILLWFSVSYKIFFFLFLLLGLLLSVLNVLTFPPLPLALTFLIFLSVFVVFWVVWACLVPLHQFSRLSLRSSWIGPWSFMLQLHTPYFCYLLVLEASLFYWDVLRFIWFFFSCFFLMCMPIL